MKMLVGHGRALIDEFSGKPLTSSTEDEMVRRIGEMSGLNVVEHHIQPTFLFFGFKSYNLRILISCGMQEVEVEALHENKKALRTGLR